MSIKISTIFYPHIVKEYDSIEQFIADNDYTEYEAKLREIMSDIPFQVSLSEDNFEAIVTVEYETEEQRGSISEQIESATQLLRRPIYEEDISNHLF